MTDNCCHDDTDTYKLTADFTFSHLNIDFNQIPIVLPALSFYYLSILDMRSADSDFISFIPPRKIPTTLSIFQTYRL